MVEIRMDNSWPKSTCQDSEAEKEVRKFKMKFKLPKVKKKTWKKAGHAAEAAAPLILLS